MKRVMTLVSSILGTVMSGITALFAFIIAIAGVGVGAMDGQEVVDSTTGETFVFQSGMAEEVLLAIGLVLAFLCIAGIVINALCIKLWRKPAGEYKKGLVVTAIVFNAVSAILCFVMVVTIFFAIVFTATTILYIIDLCREKSRIENAKLEEVKVEKEQTNVQPEAVVEVKAEPDTQPAQKVVEKGSLEDKIIRLNEMKKNGLISDEDYETLKKDLINKELTK